MTIINTLPDNIVDGDPLDAAPVMANFNQIVTNVNANAADLNQQNTFSQPQNGVAAVLPAQFVTLAQVQALFNAILPVGAIVDYAGGSALASNFLLCDGSAVNRTTYAGLFGAIGTAFGAGDGATTFNVPDMRRRTSIGSGGTGTFGSTTGSAGGAETHVMTVAELVSHAHGITDPTHAHSLYDPGHNHGVNDPGHAHSIADPGHTHGYTVSGANGQFAQNAANWALYAPNTGANTAASGTGIGIYAALTSIYLSAAATGMAVYGAATGISVQAQGSSSPLNMMQPSMVVTKMIRFQ